MIGDFVYVISSKTIYLDGFDLPTYEVNGVATEIDVSDIYYIDSPSSRYTFNSVSAIDLDDGDVNSEAYLMDSSSWMYVSQDNIYLTYMKRVSMKNYVERFAEEVALPVLPSVEDKKIRVVLNSDDSDSKKMRDIGEILEEYVDGNVEQAAELMEELQERMEEFQIKIQKEIEKTIIHRIGIDGMDIDYEAKGEVTGRILDQFAMDEFDGKFRVATTVGNNWQGVSLNNLYVLDDDLDVIGELEDLAPTEQIYSARFMGERAYMVTFRQVDPLYVIDLSSPRNPEVLGYLKITGYSDYLHPYDENHLIGVGKEADEDGRVRGVKISLFDVSDVENPIELDKYEVDEGRWSHSEALYDHHAFLFDREKELLVIPVSYTEEVGVNENGWKKWKYWQGAFVFNIGLDGISLRGEITHDSNESDDDYWYGGDYVRRALYMDDVLYTISNSMIKANDLFDLDFISEVDLPWERPWLYGRGLEE